MAGQKLLVSILTAIVFFSGNAHGLDLKKKYERTLINWALKKNSLQVDPNPAGKTIERVIIEREKIISQSDPWPNFINIFHVKTKEYIVRQELLIGTGEVWNQERVDESIRNLRGLFVLAVARAVPCKSKTTGKVVLLVVTKDLWSIRINTAFSQTGLVLGALEFNPTEENFLGHNKRISLRIGLSQLNLDGFKLRDQMRFGQAFVDPRLFGTRLHFQEAVDILVDGDVPCGGVNSIGETWCPDTKLGKPSGVFAHLLLKKPLFSFQTPWAFLVQARLSIKKVRFFRQNSGKGELPLGENAGISLRSVVFEDHPDGVPRAVPFVYNDESFLTSASFTRALGKEIKHYIAWGIVAYRSHQGLPGNFPFDATTKQWFTSNFLPFNETAAYFFLQYSTRTKRYVRLRNVQTYALSEDFWLGHKALAQIRFAQNLTYADRAFLVGRVELAYRWFAKGNLVWVAADATTRYQGGIETIANAQKETPWTNNIFRMGIKNISPILWIGRLHAQATATFRYNDLNNSFSSLGGGIDFREFPDDRIFFGGLRGYAADQFQGSNVVSTNVEFRSLPINFYTLHFGFVVFYDGGTVWGEDLAPVWKHSVGAGVRGHFPQFDKESLRVDFGFPLTSDRGSVGTWFSLSFSQVF